MFTSIFDSSSDLSYQNVALIIGITLVSSFILSVSYILTHKDRKDNRGFVGTIISLPVIVAFIINLVASDIARAFSLAGVFALIRFRSEPGEAKDITYILTCAGIGLAAGLGYIVLAITMAVVMAVIFIILDYTKFGYSRKALKKLKILVPENINYEGLFDSVLNKYCISKTLTKIKTTDFGSLYELSYNIILKDDNKSNDFINEIRVLNANLEVSLNLMDKTCEF